MEVVPGQSEEAFVVWKKFLIVNMEPCSKEPAKRKYWAHVKKRVGEKEPPSPLACLRRAQVLSFVHYFAG